MFTLTWFFTLIAAIIVLAILWKIFQLVIGWLNLPGPIVQIIYWVVVLLVVLWLFGLFGIGQPIIR